MLLSPRFVWIALLVIAAGPATFAQQAGTSRKSAASPKIGRPGAPKSASRPSVIMITIDTLRADHVGCYGAQNVKTPTDRKSVV